MKLSMMGQWIGDLSIQGGLPMMNLYMYHKYLRIADNLLPVFSIEANFILYIKFFYHKNILWTIKLCYTTLIFIWIVHEKTFIY
jgi:hypothetical protein